MAERDRQDSYSTEDQDWRERERSSRYEGPSQSWQGGSGARSTREGSFGSQSDYGDPRYGAQGGQQSRYGDYGSRGGEYGGGGFRGDPRSNSERGYGPPGNYPGQQSGYRSGGFQTGFDRGAAGGYGPSGEATDYSGYGSQERSGQGPRGGYGSQTVYGGGQSGYAPGSGEPSGYGGYNPPGGYGARPQSSYGPEGGFGSGRQGQYGPSGEAPNYAGYGSHGGPGADLQSGQRQQARMQRRGPKGYRRSDERIREDLCERLMESDLDASEVTVDVKDGKVILQGSVPERRMKHAIEDMAEQCSGVTDVENNVRVSRQSSGTSWFGTAESSEVDGLNRCLRSELSAIETYRQALDRDRQQYGGQAEFQRLSDILREHEEAASRLHEAVRQAGGEPSRDSGAWGTWSKITMGTAKLFGDKAALKALKEGEESGLKEYERFERESNPSTATRNLSSDLMRRQQRHIRELDALIDAAEKR